MIRSGTDQASFFYDGISDVTQFSKFAISYKLNDFAFWVNGTKVGTDTNGITPIGLNSISFNDGSGDDKFLGKTKCLAVFPYLTDTELTELTTI